MTGPRQTVLRLLEPVLSRAGSAYLVAGDRSAAIATAQRLLGCGADVTLAYWPGTGEPPAAVLAENLAVIDQLQQPVGRPRLAVKAPAFGNERGASRRLGQEARDAGVGLVFDSHSPSEADASLALAEVARGEGAQVGVALPARWTRSAQDAATAAKAGLSVRLVKGQWPDGGSPRGPSGERALRSSYLALLDRLVDRRIPVSLATHDVVLLDAALARLGSAAVLGEVELLLGLSVRRPLDTAVRHGGRVRFYLGFGHPSLAYSLTSVLRRPRLARTLVQGLALGARNQQVQQREAYTGLETEQLSHRSTPLRGRIHPLGRA